MIIVTGSSIKQATPYIRMIENHGEQARLLTHRSKGSISEIIEVGNGIMLTGGADIHPSFYGQLIDPSAGVKTAFARDEFELALLKEALSRDIPVLGICRGMQLINVALGGCLLQHIEGHKLIETERHSIFISPGTNVRGLYGGKFPKGSSSMCKMSQIRVLLGISFDQSSMYFSIQL